MDEDSSLKKKNKLSPRSLIVTCCLVCVISSGTLFLCSIVVVMIYSLCTDEQWLEMAKEHSAASTGLPIAAVIAFLLVSILNITANEEIKIKAPGFELSGASGPVVLWIACYLALAGSLKLLW